MSMPSKATDIQQLRSILRGYLWLSMPLPFLTVCTAYLTFGWRLLAGLLIGVIWIALISLMALRFCEIRKALKASQNEQPARNCAKHLRCLILMLCGLGGLGIVINPQLPLYVRGIFASVCHLLFILSQYQKIQKERDCNDE